MMGVVKVIVGGFIGEGFSNNARKRHLWTMIVVESQKVKLDDQEKGHVIFFSNEDYCKGFNLDYDDSMVIIAAIHNYAIKRFLIDQGSLANNLYSTIVASMNITKFDLNLHNGNLIGFLGKQVLVEGMIRLRVTLGTWLVVVKNDIDFLVINALNNVYNAIQGRTLLNKERAIFSKPPSINEIFNN